MSWCDKHECYESDYGSQCRDREIAAARIKVLEAEVSGLGVLLESAITFIEDGSSCPGEHSSEAGLASCEECCFVIGIRQGIATSRAAREAGS